MSETQTTITPIDPAWDCPKCNQKNAGWAKACGRCSTTRGEIAEAQMWTIDDAITFCRMAEAICTPYGCHVALTGGALYRDGARKDLDVVFYRIRQITEINVVGLIESLAEFGITVAGDFGFCVKLKTATNKTIDALFPERAAKASADTY